MIIGTLLYATKEQGLEVTHRSGKGKTVIELESEHKVDDDSPLKYASGIGYPFLISGMEIKLDDALELRYCTI